MIRDKPDLTRTILRWVLAAGYTAAGIFHLLTPDPFLAIVPNWVPAPETTVMLTGCCELAGAAALLIPRLRKLAGVMLALYAICVFPANINHAINHIAIDGEGLSWAYHGPRLALQPVLVWWALFCGSVINWPRRAP